jgi:hypothetical protein
VRLYAIFVSEMSSRPCERRAKRDLDITIIYNNIQYCCAYNILPTFFYMFLHFATIAIILTARDKIARSFDR